MVGITEKGYVSVELLVEIPGGHSSAPRGEGAIGVLSGCAASGKNQMPA
jgi:hypothetical protein